MSALHVLQIAHDHPDWIAGGTGAVAHDLARSLGQSAGVRSTLLVASTSLQRPHGTPGALGALGPDLVLHTGAYDRFSMTRLDGTAWVASVARVLAEVRPHVVHLHGLDRIGAEIVPLVRRLAPRTRIVLTLHDYQLICPNEGLLLTVPEGARCAGHMPDRCRACFPGEPAARHALRRTHLLALLQGVDVFIAPSRFLADRFAAWGLEPSRIELLPNAVPAAPARATSAPLRRDRFAFFGTIAAHKGVLTLLDATSRLKAAGAEIDLVLHGGMRHAPSAFAGAFSAGLEAAQPLARHAGPYDRAEVGRLMAAVDWVVVPSLWWENAPLVILEAQAAGRPVICSGIGGLAELVEDRATGLHVPPGDPAALARAMQEAAVDPALWGRLAANAVRSDHDAFVSRHLALYGGLLRRRAAA